MPKRWLSGAKRQPRKWMKQLLLHKRKLRPKAIRRIGTRYRHATSSIRWNEMSDSTNKWPMTKEISMTNDEKAQHLECRTISIFAFGPGARIRNSGFVIISSFVIRHSS